MQFVRYEACTDEPGVRAELQRLSQSDDTAALEDAIRRFQAASERWSAMEEEYLALRDA